MFLFPCKQNNRDESIRVTELLDQIQRGDYRRFSKFCEALENSGQEHIVTNFLKKKADATDAILNDECQQSSERPIPIYIQKGLGYKWNDVIQILHSDASFLTALETLDVFTKLQIKKLKVMTKLKSVIAARLWYDAFIHLNICCILCLQRACLASHSNVT